MSGNSIGALFKVTTWGESHGSAIGVVVDGCPAGLELNETDIQKELDRRRPGQSKYATPRKEADQVEILSGVFEGKTTGTPLAMLVYNRDSINAQYEKIKNTFRPGHADFTYHVKYGHRDFRGGGRSSGRETVSRVAAGAIAKKILSHFGIQIRGFTRRIGKTEIREVIWEEIEKNPLYCPDPDATKAMISEIEEALREGDSLGGIVEVWASGVPAGLGEPVFDKLDADLAKALVSLGAVKGIEFGLGFALSGLRGSESNDELCLKEGGKIGTRTNNAGGIVGGISNGEDIVLRIAVKPTPSISKSQNSVSAEGQPMTLKVEGRHDPVICPRIVPVAEAMVALILVDHLFRSKVNRMDRIV
ncbi:MAG: chorismate synthase [Candidatus Tectomicrobia bacterium]|uniref:Chorismate synthase n=1 Tax=Tectimicrobiota bacterium TaxID=2528274 RepID=A0A933LQL4_UNCTE|nr:chorismate synthase [Candidatus Tectomicrobia bacterium]